MNYRKLSFVGLSAILLTACSVPQPPAINGQLVNVNQTKPLTDIEQQTQLLFMMNQQLESLITLTAKPPLKEPTSTRFNVYYPYNVFSFKTTPELRYIVDNAKKAKRINILGRTDGNKPTARDKYVAMSRATNVRNYLVNNGINPTLIFVNYAAATDYADSNWTAKGRANNRRVEIEIIGD